MPRSPSVDTDLRRLIVGFVGLCAFVGVAVLIFTWPVSRIGPRALPVGVVAPTAEADHVTGELDRTRPGAFDVHRYPDEAEVRLAVRHRAVYGAFVLSDAGVHIVTSGASGATVAQIVTAAGNDVATGLGVGSAVTDEVPYAPADRTGAVFSITLLPLTVCCLTIATILSQLSRRMRAWWEMLGLVAVASVGALITYLVAQTWLGALPHQPLATWATMALMILAISATASGLISLLGTAGTLAAAVLLLFVGNSFAGSQSAPELLPSAAKVIGQALPPGAGTALLRNVTYFGGRDWVGHVVVLVCWTIVGLAAVFVGHQRAARASLHPAPAHAVVPAAT